jgi:hypothetical protein
MIVWGGNDSDGLLNTGGRYSPPGYSTVTLFSVNDSINFEIDDTTGGSDSVNAGNVSQTKSRIRPNVDQTTSARM